MEFAPTLFFWQLMVTALFGLCIMSLVIGHISSEKSFLFYGIYTFFLLFYFVLVTPYDFVWRDQLFTTPYKSLRWYSQVIYNCSYFIFFLYFLDIKTHIPKFNKFIVKVVGVAFSLGTLVFIYGIILNKPDVFEVFYIYIFVPILFCFAIYTLVKSITLPGRLKYFFIAGGGVFIVFAMLALFLPILGYRIFNLSPFAFFYTGVYIEQFVFAFGLAYKVRQMNHALLEKSIENQHIKEAQNKVLEEKLKEKEHEILAITTKAEEERLSSLKSKFEDEIHRLHLVSLQSQLNPHFIFNALNSIKAFLIENDKQQGIDYLYKFSKLIRIILENIKVETITLVEELAILKLYVDIENIRFEEKINLNIRNLEKVHIKNMIIPPMILQPFIENAIWHGLMLKEGEKWIDLLFFQEESTLILKIRDNGNGRQANKQHEGRKLFKKKSIGLKITQERLNHFNQKNNLDYTFKIHDLRNERGGPIGTEIEFIFRTNNN